MAQERGEWGSRMGFIMAASGSAAGLGNIWKFPCMTGQNGGGASLSLGVWRDATLFVGWVIWPRAAAEISTATGRVPAWAPAWRAICRYVAPAVIAWILIAGL